MAFSSMRRRQTPYGVCEATATTTPKATRSLFLFAIVVAVSLSQLSSSSLVKNAVNLRSTNQNNSNNHILEQQQQHLQHDGIARRDLVMFKGPEEKVLETTMVGGNSFSGVMFDVEAKTNLMLETLSCNINSKNAVVMSVYTKQGTFQNNMMEPGRWIKVVDNIELIGKCYGRLTPIPKDAMRDIPLKAGTTQAFYIHLNLPRVQYTNGDIFDANVEMGDVFTANDDMAIRSGVGMGHMEAFDAGVTISPEQLYQKVENQMWNGQVHYRLALDLALGSRGFNDGLEGMIITSTNYVNPTNAQLDLDESLLDSHFDQTVLHTLETNYNGTNGSNGLMFDVQTSTDVPPGGLRVLTLDLHIDSSPEEQYLTVFTKLDSFMGDESNPHAWRRVFSGTVVGEGGGNPTRLPPDMFDSMIIHRESSQAFYVVMEEPLLKYGDGTQVGKSLTEDSFLQIREGSGSIAQVFGGSIDNGNNAIGPRAFNGAVHYDLLDSKGVGSGTNSIMVAEGPIHSLVTSTEGGNTAFGIIFDVISIKGIQVQSLQVHLSKDGDHQQYVDHDNELDLEHL
jgi:hypothetical protein